MTVGLEVLVEEYSAEVALRALLPKIVPDVPFAIYQFNGKANFLRKLPGRLRGYAPIWSAADLRIVVLVDRDTDECVELKERLLQMVSDAGLPADVVVCRIAIEELEAWFLGDVPALRTVYPQLPASLAQQAKYRDPDGIVGGTWEALEHVLVKNGYRRGLRKVETAANVARHMNVESNRSRSFEVFRDGVRRLVKEDAK